MPDLVHELAFPRTAPRRVRPFLAALAVALVALLGLAYSSGLFRNPYTPPGYVGYLTRGALFGHARFVGLQAGPTSSGLGWMPDVTNVSVTPYTYSEEFSGDSAVLAADSLKMWRTAP